MKHCGWALRWGMVYAERRGQGVGVVGTGTVGRAPTGRFRPAAPPHPRHGPNSHKKTWSAPSVSAWPPATCGSSLTASCGTPLRT